MKKLSIKELYPELIIDKNIILAPTSYDAMLELRLYMNQIGCTAYKMPSLKKEVVDSFSRIKFDLARKENENTRERAKRSINFDTTKVRNCINIESYTQYWQSPLEYYLGKIESGKPLQIIEIFLPENYQCLFDEELIRIENSRCGYKEEKLNDYIALAKKIKFGNYKGLKWI